MDGASCGSDLELSPNEKAAALEALRGLGSYVSIQGSKLPMDQPKGKKRSNLATHQTRKRFNIGLADKLQEGINSGLYEYAEAIRHCGDNILFLDHPDGTSRIIPEHTCSKRFCSICANKRTRKTIARYAQKIEEFIADKHAYHFVLTYKNMDHLLDRSQISKHLRNIFRRSIWDKYSNKTLTSRDSTHVAGALYSIETTYNTPKDQFHPHVHCLVVTDKPIKTYWDKKEKKFKVDHYTLKNELQDIWREISNTGTDQENFIVYGERWNKGHVAELIKYATKLEKTTAEEQQKLSDMPKDRLVELIKWTNGRRQLAALGGLYNYTIGIEKEVEQQIAAEMVKDLFVKTEHVRIKLTYNHEANRYVETARSIEGVKLPDDQPENIAERKRELIKIKVDRLDVRLDRRVGKLEESNRVVAMVEKSKTYVTETGEITAEGMLKDKFEHEAKKETYQITSLLRKRKAYEMIAI